VDFSKGIDLHARVQITRSQVRDLSIVRLGADRDPVPRHLIDTDASLIRPLGGLERVEIVLDLQAED